MRTKKRTYWTTDPTFSIKWGKSQTDDKFFTPTAESVKNMMISGQTAGDMGEQLYDFPDGKDDGRELNITRWEGVDRAEISQAQIKTQQELKDIKNEEKFNKNMSQKKAQQAQEQVNILKTAIEATKTEPKAQTEK